VHNPTVLDLFSGCGGMSWGLHKAGFQILAGIDNWEPALRTFKHNHRTAEAVHADLTQLKPEEVRRSLRLDCGELDVIVGGPPCQGFSKNVPAAYRFLADPRNHLFQDYLGFVREFRPKVVVMENVAEIYNAYSGSVREEILATLDRLGYTTTVEVIFAPAYGVPQRRRRCFFFASRTGVAPAIPEPGFAPEERLTILGRIEQYRSAWSAISDLPILQNGEGVEPTTYDQAPQNEYQHEMRRDSDELFNHVTRELRAKQFARVCALGPGEGIKNLPDHLRPKSGYSGAYGRLDFEGLAPTMTRWCFHPGSGRFCHPRERRLITTREAARLQSFSDDFRFIGSFIEMAHQIGNAVPPLLMKAFAANIYRCLRGRLESEMPIAATGTTGATA
jgi:DNA (cytosine-5)-methyltransferase 1